MGVLPLADRHLRSVGTEENGAATARAGVDGEQQLFAHVIGTSGRLVTLTSSSPAAKRPISSAIISAPCIRVSRVAPPICGVITMFPWRSRRCGPAAGEDLTTSRAAPASAPDAS